ncbi:DUF1259 domain-containing protein [Sporosarcina sp. USHLN248]|uniref:DUF1259 domain-containing protein n=1 Tax=Sporosarcina sp. USHLN248 TaxID=3081300 RepID=UPI0038B68D6F
MLTKLRQNGLVLTTVHNYCLFDIPRLMYMRYQAIDLPLFFARRVQNARSVLV